MGAGGRAVEPERALEIPRRAFLESRSLPKERFGTPLSATKRWRSPARRLRRSTGFAYSLPLEADSDRLLVFSGFPLQRLADKLGVLPWGQAQEHGIQLLVAIHLGSVVCANSRW